MNENTNAVSELTFKQLVIFLLVKLGQSILYKTPIRRDENSHWIWPCWPSHS